VQSAETLAQGGQFFQQVRHFFRQVRKATRRRAIRFEPRIDPEITEHFEQMGFAAAIKAADPRSRLCRRSQVVDIRLQDSDESVFVLAFADEVLQFVAESLNFILSRGFADTGYAIVLQLVSERIAGE